MSVGDTAVPAVGEELSPLRSTGDAAIFDAEEEGADADHVTLGFPLGCGTVFVSIAPTHVACGSRSSHSVRLSRRTPTPFQPSSDMMLDPSANIYQRRCS